MLREAIRIVLGQARQFAADRGTHDFYLARGGDQPCLFLGFTVAQLAASDVLQVGEHCFSQHHNLVELPSKFTGLPRFKD